MGGCRHLFHSKWQIGARCELPAIFQRCLIGQNYLIWPGQGRHFATKLDHPVLEYGYRARECQANRPEPTKSFVGCGSIAQPGSEDPEIQILSHMKCTARIKSRQTNASVPPVTIKHSLIGNAAYRLRRLLYYHASLRNGVHYRRLPFLMNARS